MSLQAPQQVTWNNVVSPLLACAIFLSKWENVMEFLINKDHIYSDYIFIWKNLEKQKYSELLFYDFTWILQMKQDKSIFNIQLRA